MAGSVKGSDVNPQRQRGPCTCPCHRGGDLGEVSLSSSRTPFHSGFRLRGPGTQPGPRLWGAPEWGKPFSQGGGCGCLGVPGVRCQEAVGISDQAVSRGRASAWVQREPGEQASYSLAVSVRFMTRCLGTRQLVVLEGVLGGG